MPVTGRDHGTEAAALASATQAYETFLGPGLMEFSLSGLDTVGMPVWSTWWTGPSGVGMGGIGYAMSEERARLGALGECVEHAAAALALPRSEPDDGSLRQVRARYGNDGVADPRTLGLPAGEPFDEDRPLRWLPMRRLRDDRDVLVPAELVASSGGELGGGPPPAGWLTTPISNGLGAGSSFDMAVAHAVLEILQRDGNGLRFRALDAGVVLDLDGVTDPVTLAALDLLRRAGVSVLAKLASTDFGMANIYVVGAAEDDDILSATACGEAVHPDRDIALRKAVLEFANARARKQFMHGPLEAVRQVAPPGYDQVIDAMDAAGEEGWVLQAMVDWLRSPRSEWRPRVESTVLRQVNHVRFDDLPTTPFDGSPGLADVAARLAEEGFDILVRDLSPGPGHPLVRAVKVLVPGLEVETVAYSRIGERNAARLLAAGRDDLVRVSTRAPEGWSSIALTSAAEERLGGPAWLNTRALRLLADGLLPLYREPSRHTAQKVLA